jgi:hypothetical protein
VSLQGIDVNYMVFAELHKEPNKVLDGMVVLADGTDWNPASSGVRGLYRYQSNGEQWIFVG